MQERKSPCVGLKKEKNLALSTLGDDSKMASNQKKKERARERYFCEN